MPTSLKSLSELFNRRIYRIPDYQRGYAWEDGQLEDFWDDLMRLGPDRAHYTGQITLVAVPRERWDAWGEEERWLVQDGWKVLCFLQGQLRQTSAILLFNVILDRILCLNLLRPDIGSDLVVW